MPLAPGCWARARSQIESNCQARVELTRASATVRFRIVTGTPHAHPIPVPLRAGTSIIAHAPGAPFAPFCVASYECKKNKKREIEFLIETQSNFLD